MATPAKSKRLQYSELFLDKTRSSRSTMGNIVIRLKRLSSRRRKNLEKKPYISSSEDSRNLFNWRLWMEKIPKRFGFNLPNPFPVFLNGLPHFFQRTQAAVMPAKARLKKLPFPFCQGVRHLNESFFNARRRYSFRRHCIGWVSTFSLMELLKNRDGVLKEIRGKSAAAPFFSRALRRSSGISILSVSSFCGGSRPNSGGNCL